MKPIYGKIVQAVSAPPPLTGEMKVLTKAYKTIVWVFLVRRMGKTIYTQQSGGKWYLHGNKILQAHLQGRGSGAKETHVVSLKKWGHEMRFGSATIPLPAFPTRPRYSWQSSRWSCSTVNVQ